MSDDESFFCFYKKMNNQYVKVKKNEANKSISLSNNTSSFPTSKMNTYQKSDDGASKALIHCRPNENLDSHIKNKRLNMSNKPSSKIIIDKTKLIKLLKLARKNNLEENTIKKRADEVKVLSRSKEIENGQKEKKIQINKSEIKNKNNQFENQKEKQDLDNPSLKDPEYIDSIRKNYFNIDSSSSRNYLKKRPFIPSRIPSSMQNVDIKKQKTEINERSNGKFGELTPSNEFNKIENSSAIECYCVPCLDCYTKKKNTVVSMSRMLSEQQISVQKENRIQEKSPRLAIEFPSFKEHSREEEENHSKLRSQSAVRDSSTKNVRFPKKRAESFSLDTEIKKKEEKRRASSGQLSFQHSDTSQKENALSKMTYETLYSNKNNSMTKVVDRGKFNKREFVLKKHKDKNKRKVNFSSKTDLSKDLPKKLNTYSKSSDGALSSTKTISKIKRQNKTTSINNNEALVVRDSPKSKIFSNEDKKLKEKSVKNRDKMLATSGKTKAVSEEKIQNKATSANNDEVLVVRDSSKSKIFSNEDKKMKEKSVKHCGKTMATSDKTKSAPEEKRQNKITSKINDEVLVVRGSPKSKIFSNEDKKVKEKNVKNSGKTMVISDKTKAAPEERRQDKTTSINNDDVLKVRDSPKSKRFLYEDRKMKERNVQNSDKTKAAPEERRENKTTRTNNDEVLEVRDSPKLKRFLDEDRNLKEKNSDETVVISDKIKAAPEERRQNKTTSRNNDDVLEVRGSPKSKRFLYEDRKMKERNMENSDKTVVIIDKIKASPEERRPNKTTSRNNDEVLEVRDSPKSKRFLYEDRKMKERNVQNSDKAKANPEERIQNKTNSTNNHEVLEVRDSPKLERFIDEDRKLKEKNVQNSDKTVVICDKTKTVPEDNGKNTNFIRKNNTMLTISDQIKTKIIFEVNKKIGEDSTTKNTNEMEIVSIPPITETVIEEEIYPRKNNYEIIVIDDLPETTDFFEEEPKKDTEIGEMTADNPPKSKIVFEESEKEKTYHWKKKNKIMKADDISKTKTVNDEKYVRSNMEVIVIDDPPNEKPVIENDKKEKECKVLEKNDEIIILSDDDDEAKRPVIQPQQTNKKKRKHPNTGINQPRYLYIDISNDSFEIEEILQTTPGIGAKSNDQKHQFKTNSAFKFRFFLLKALMKPNLLKKLTQARKEKRSYDCYKMPIDIKLQFPKDKTSCFFDIEDLQLKRKTHSTGKITVLSGNLKREQFVQIVRYAAQIIRVLSNGGPNN